MNGTSAVGTAPAILIGPPGAEVPRTALALGALLGLTVRDTDEDLARAAGQPVGQLFVERGEAAFRVLERAAALAALTEETGVIALGGGAVFDPDVAAALTDRPVAFLDVELGDAARRLGFSRERPAAVSSPRSLWLAQMTERRPEYRRLATVTVATDGLTPEQVAEDVARGLDLRREGEQR